MEFTSWLVFAGSQSEATQGGIHCEVELKSHENHSIKTLKMKRYTKLKIGGSCRPGRCLRGPHESETYLSFTAICRCLFFNIYSRQAVYNLVTILMT